MPYAVDFSKIVPFAEGMIPAAVTGGIWVPPPSSGSSPGTPAFTGTVTSDSLLAFPSLSEPPPGTSAMLVSQPAKPGVSGDFGDLFRSGPTAAFPASPAPLNGFIGPAVLDQGKLDNLTSTFAGLTIDLSSADNSAIFWAVVGLSGGWICPGTLTASNASLLLGAAGDGTLTLKVSGTLVAQHFFTPWTDTYPWSFTELLTFAPSGDPVDIGNILAVNFVSPAISMPGVLGYVVKPFAPLVAGAVTPMIQAMINQAIPPAVNALLIQNGEEMTPTAVISFNKTTFDTAANPATVTFVLTVADIFGPGTKPVNTTVVPDVIDDNALEAARELRTAQLGAHFNTREPGFVVTGQNPQGGTTVVVDSVVEVIMGPPNLGD